MNERSYAVLREEDADLNTTGRVMGGLGDLGLSPEPSDPALWVVAVGAGAGAPDALLDELARRRPKATSRVLIVAHPAGLDRAAQVAARLGSDYAIAGAADGFRFRRPGALGLGQDAAALTQFLGFVTAGI